jgi:hypothetical protein
MALLARSVVAARESAVSPIAALQQRDRDGQVDTEVDRRRPVHVPHESPRKSRR